MEKKKSFWCAIGVQAQGAFNDNAYKNMLSLLAMDLVTSQAAQGKLLAVIGALFTLPYLLFSTFAGYMADRYSKRHVFIFTKAFEIVIMTLGLIAFAFNSLYSSLCLLFLMGLQSTLFSPSKYGILPEVLPVGKIAWGNGILQLTTFVAIILGTVVGAVLSNTFKPNLEWGMVFLVGFSFLGLLSARSITPLAIADATRRPTWNPFADFGANLMFLIRRPTLKRATLGIAYFWFVGVLVQMNLLLYGKRNLGLDDSKIGVLMALMAIGIGVGSWIAGTYSKEASDLRFWRMGAIGLFVFSVLLALPSPGFAISCLFVVALGLVGGFYIVPLNAALQHDTPLEKRGILIATDNILSAVTMLIGSLVYYLIVNVMNIGAQGVFWFLAGSVIIVHLIFAYIHRRPQDASPA